MRRRIMVALLILLVFGGASVAAGYDKETARTTIWDIPSLHIGDQGRYVSDEGEAFVFVIEREEQVPRRDGTMGPALAIHVQGSSRSGPLGDTILTTWIDENGSVIAGRNWTDGAGAGGGIQAEPLRTVAYGGYNLWETVWGVHHLPCGFVHDGQGQTVVSSMQGLACRMQEQGGVFVHETGSVTLGNDVPVPLRLSWLGHEWNLTEFARGAAPIVTEATVYHVETARGVIPDDAGIALEFPLDEALAFAQTPGLGLRLGAFLQRDGAYLAAASFSTQYDQGSRERTWTLIASDGREEVAASFTKDMAQADRTSAVLPVGTGLVLPDGPAIRWSDLEPPMVAFPPMDALPEYLPKVASVQSLRAAAFGQDSVDAWGFAHACESCSSAMVWVGEHAHQWFEPELVGSVCALVCAQATNLLMQDTLAVDPDGNPLHRGQSDYIYYRHVEAGPPVVDANGGKPTPAPLAIIGGTQTHFALTTASVGLSFLGLVAALAYYFGPNLKQVVGTALFSRVSKDGALDHPVRARIMDAVKAEPGQHALRLARAVKIQESTLRHHVQQLEASGLVRTVRRGGFRCVFPAEASRADIAVAGLKTGRGRAVLDAARQHPGLSMAELADHMGTSPANANYHVGRLVDAGLLERRKEGRIVRIFPGRVAA